MRSAQTQGVQRNMTDLASLHLQPPLKSRWAQALIELDGQQRQALGLSRLSAAPVAAAKDAHGNGEGLIVDESSVDREYGHQENHIAACREAQPSTLAI